VQRRWLPLRQTISAKLPSDDDALTGSDFVGSGDFPFVELEVDPDFCLAIPRLLLRTFIVMASFGFNLETPLALALVIGIIVDDAIVDVENITRHIDGEPPDKLRFQLPDWTDVVTAATLTIVAVFSLWL